MYRMCVVREEAVGIGRIDPSRMKRAVAVMRLCESSSVSERERECVAAGPES